MQVKKDLCAFPECGCEDQSACTANKKPEALELAEKLKNVLRWFALSDDDRARAADELCRLHGENAALQMELLERARLLGIGSEKEARLTTVIEELRADLRSVIAVVDGISKSLRSAGASLPAPEPKGTPESGVMTGMCIALAVAESGVAQARSKLISGT